MDIFTQQNKLCVTGFQRLKEREAVEFAFWKSAGGLGSVYVTGPGGVFSSGSERQLRGRTCRSADLRRQVLQLWRSGPPCEGLQSAPQRPSSALTARYSQPAFRKMKKGFTILLHEAQN